MYFPPTEIHKIAYLLRPLSVSFQFRASGKDSHSQAGSTRGEGDGWGGLPAPSLLFRPVDLGHSSGEKPCPRKAPQLFSLVEVGEGSLLPSHSLIR